MKETTILITEPKHVVGETKNTTAVEFFSNRRYEAILGIDGTSSANSSEVSFKTLQIFAKRVP